MRIAITGANGQLGTALRHQLAGHDLIPLTHADLDLALPQTAEQIAAVQADVVIHPAAYTNVDGCAREPERAYRVNTLGSKYVALGCARSGAALVYISTNEVFSGAGQQTYYEYDAPAPVNPYGWSKWGGEQAVREVLDRVYIARVAWLFGGERNFVRTMIRLADERGALSVVEDEIGSPTSVEDVASAIDALIQTQHYGTYHLVNSGAVSRHGFAQEILRQSGRAEVPVTPMRLADFRRDSTVPPHTPLHTIAATDLGIALPPWQDALERFIHSASLARGAAS